MDSKKLGFLGEGIAEKYLKDKRYKILDKNFSVRQKLGPQKAEIDIIAKEKDIVSFIEVKTLSNKQSQFFLPEDKVNFLKQRKIAKAAEIWLMKNKMPLDSKWQIDVISIIVDKDKKLCQLKHFKNINF